MRVPHTILILISAVFLRGKRSVFKSRHGLLFLVTVLILLAWILLDWQPRPNSFVLPNAVASSKLDSGEYEDVAKAAPVAEPALLVVPAAVEIAEPPPPPASIAAPESDRGADTPRSPVVVETPTPVENREVEAPRLPEIEEIPPIDSHPGEPPMNLCKNLTVKIVLAGWLVGNAAAADTPKDLPPGIPADRLGKIEANIVELQRDAKKLADSLKSALDTITSVSERLESLTTLSVQVNSNTKDIDDLRKRVKVLEDDVARLQQQKADRSEMLQLLAQKADKSEARVSQYPAPAIPAAQKIQIINDWPTRNTVILDNVAYRLEPGETKTVEKSAMNFNYEVVGVQAPLNRTFSKTGEVFTIRIGSR